MTRDTVAAATSPAALAGASLERSPGWWGMVLFVVTESTFFACFIASYYYVRFSTPGAWPPGGIKEPEPANALIMTALLVVSACSVAWAGWAVRRGRRGQLTLALTLTLLLALAFLAVQGREYATNLDEFTWSTNAYGSLFHVISGFHGLHVVVGAVMLAVLTVAAARGVFRPARHLRVRLVTVYWYFVVATWVVTLFVLYLSPRV